MSANSDEQHQRQIQARIDACQSELGNLEAEQQRLAGRYSTLKARIEALREELQPSHCQAEPFDQWSADAALAEKRGGRDRDPYLPPPEVCKWLLEQEWSEGRVVDQRVTSMAGRLLQSGTLINSSLALVAIGADETGHFELPVEALEVLKADQQARREAIERKRAAIKSDELERKRQRDEDRVNEAGDSDPNQPLPRGGIVLNGEDTGSLLLEAILTLREIAKPEKGAVYGSQWCCDKAKAMLDRIQSVGEVRP